MDSDELNQYLTGGSTLSRQYRSEDSPLPPHSLDRTLLRAAHGAHVHGARKSQCLAPLAFASCALLSLALVAALTLAPISNRGSDTPQVTKVRLYSEQSDTRRPSQWLADIAALRRAGRYREAAEQMQRFHSVYPHYIISSDE